MGLSFAEHCEQMEEEEAQRIEEERRAPCPDSPGYRNCDCRVITVNTKKDQCTTCKKVWYY